MLAPKPLDPSSLEIFRTVSALARVIYMTAAGDQQWQSIHDGEEKYTTSVRGVNITIGKQKPFLKIHDRDITEKLEAISRYSPDRDLYIELLNAIQSQENLSYEDACLKIVNS